MDDYIQILIYLFIIFAFLNSLFRKKDKGQTPKKTGSSYPQQRNTNSSEETAKQSREEYDILREIEEMFKGENAPSARKREMESEIEKEKMQKVPVEEHAEEPEWHQESPDEHELDKSWHTMTEGSRIPKIDKKIEKEAEIFEQLLISRQEEETIDFRELRYKLYSPQSLKEYMVFSEIIGRPKYLRR